MAVQNYVKRADEGANTKDAPKGGVSVKQEDAMKLRIFRLLAIAAFVSCFVASAQTLAQDAYITNSASGSLAIIDTRQFRIFSNPFIGEGGFGVAVSPDGSRAFVGYENFSSVRVWNTGINNPVPSRREFFLLADIPIKARALGVASQDRNKVYVADASGTLSVITATDAVTYKLTDTFPIGRDPRGVAVSPDGSKVYVTFSNDVSVINPATRDQKVISDGGLLPVGVAVSPDGSKYYVANEGSDNISVIDTVTNAVTARIAVGSKPFGVAVSRDGSKVYVTNTGSDTVSAILMKTDPPTVTPISVGHSPKGVALTPDGSKVFVVNEGSGSVSAIGTRLNKVIPTGTELTGLKRPVSFGVFIGPAPPAPPSFAGTPGFSNCVGQSIAVLDQQFRGRSVAAAALGFPDVQALENSVLTFCQ
jgi:YVTN family beta-propeller protein